MNSDQKYGALLFVLGLFAALFYVAIFMGSYVGVLFFQAFLWWAIAFPVILAVLAVLTIVMWIGWTMLTTPPLDIETQEKTTGAQSEDDSRT